MLLPTKSAYQLVDALVGKTGFIDLGYTQAMELKLDSLAEGKGDYRLLVGSMHAQLEAEIPTLLIAGVQVHSCPACASQLVRRKGPKGHFWSCSQYPDCKQTLPDSDGKPGERAAAGPEIQCPECGPKQGGRLRRISYEQKFFWSCTRYRDGCKAKFKDAAGRPLIKPAA